MNYWPYGLPYVLVPFLQLHLLLATYTFVMTIAINTFVDESTRHGTKTGV